MGDQLQGEGLVVVHMGRHVLTHLALDTQLLLKLSGQAGLHGLPFLDLASRELPLPRQVGRARSTAEEDPASPTQDGCSDADHLGLEGRAGMLVRPYMLKARVRTPLLLLASAAALLGLAWVDVLPGGWRLRGWVTPHDVRFAREQDQRSARRMATFEEENAAAPSGATVWLGSSTVERFPLDELFPSTSHLNRGIGGESGQELLARLGASLPAAPPARLVFYLGSIDFRHLDRTPEAIAETAEEIVTATLQTYPEHTPQVFLLGILPEQDMPEAMTKSLARTNSCLAALCATHDDWAFIETCRAPLQLRTGSLNPEYAADRLHLNHRGYQVLAAWMGWGG